MNSIDTWSPATAETNSPTWYVDTITVPYDSISISVSEISVSSERHPARLDKTKIKLTDRALTVLFMSPPPTNNYLINVNKYTLGNYY